MRFMVRLYKKQVEQGRVFLHEQPAHEKSWMIPEIRDMMSKEGITLVEADQCMYGLKTKTKKGQAEALAKKPTKFMTNSRALRSELSNKCNGMHTHQNLVDGRAHKAARYPPGLCKAMCRGIVKLKRERHENVRTVANMMAGTRRRMPDPEELHEEGEANIPMHNTLYLNKLTCHRAPNGSVSSALAWDDLTGMKLESGKVIEARTKEVQYIKDKRVYTETFRK